MRLSHRRPRRHRLATTERAQRDHGYILVEFAFLLIPLLLMVGLSVDVGYWYNRVSDIQKAADAAALAGVVWLPDEEQARIYALAAAARNGFVDEADGVEVDVDPVGERRLRVTIRDPEVGSFFFEGLGGRTIDLSRSGTAEYVLPVPLGSPRNFFGTGVLSSGYSENLWLSTNTWCTDKVDGDRYQSPFEGNRPYSDLDCEETHSGDHRNPEYRDGGYEYYVDVPASRTGDIEVLLFDARYNTGSIASADPSSVLAQCTYSYVSNWTEPQSSSQVRARGPLQFQERSNDTTTNWGSVQNLGSSSQHDKSWRRVRYRADSSGTWTAPPNSTSSSSVTITGPAIYQTRSNTNGNWSSNQTLGHGATLSSTWNLVRYRLGTISSCTDKAVDLNLYNGDHSFTYTLYGADETPLNDGDNLPVTNCSQTFSKSTSFTSGITFLGTNRWNRLCTITTGMRAGRYILRTTNTVGERYAAGANNFSIVAKYTSAGYTAGSALCDARSVATCPRVYGKDAISVFADQKGSTADFFLAEIEPIHVGKKLQIDLFDPGEGGDNIQLRRPTGANTWDGVSFTWSASNGESGGPTTSLDVTGSKFNGQTVQLVIDLAGYDPPDNNRWWQIRYNFESGPNASVTDRTTWSAKVVGDPVHLIQEEAD